MPLDPEQLDADQQTAQELRQMAALCGEFFDACRAAGLPDHLAVTLVADWHRSTLGDEVTWTADD